MRNDIHNEQPETPDGVKTQTRNPDERTRSRVQPCFFTPHFPLLRRQRHLYQHVHWSYRFPDSVLPQVVVYAHTPAAVSVDESTAVVVAAVAAFVDIPVEEEVRHTCHTSIAAGEQHTLHMDVVQYDGLVVDPIQLLKEELHAAEAEDKLNTFVDEGQSEVHVELQNKQVVVLEDDSNPVGFE